MNEENELFELPEGWIWVHVNQLYNIIGGGTPSTKIEEYWGGDIPWITSQDIHDLKDIRIRKWITREAIEKSTTKPVPKNSILVVTRVGLGKIALTGNLICFNQDIQALVDNTGLLYPFYSLYYLSKAIQIFRYKHRGTTVGGVTKKQLAELSFPLPPLEEQKQIVTKIEELFTNLDAGISSLVQTKNQLKKYRQSLLKYAFEGKLTEEWRKIHEDELELASVLLEKIKEAHNKEGKRKKRKYKDNFVDDSDLYELPEGWIWVHVNQLYNIIGGGTPSTKIEEYWGGDIPWITSQDIHDLKDIRIRKWITREAIEKSTTKPVPKNSILVVTRVGLGKIALTGNLICFNQDIQALVDNTGLLYPFYSLYYLSKAIQIFRYKHRGTTVGGVTKKQLAELSFPLPPLEEQKQIVEILEQQFSIIDELEKTIEINLKKAERLRQSILKKAFRGKLIPQDSSDKPAHLLLERIKAQKEREKNDKRKSKKNTFDSNQTRLIDYDK